jgi:protein-L-isoaspartate(D-aspartate) O-methyltransferase
MRIVFAALTALLLGGGQASGQGPAAAEREEQDDDAYAARREQMVKEQIASGAHGRLVQDSLVLSAMRRVPRHAFVPAEYAHLAYTDQPLPIAAGQTISQPFIVALMTELAQVHPGARVLEIGTGSGYQAAVLAEITDAVYSIEIIEELARSAQRTLRKLGYGVHVRVGDGFFGWPEEVPFDAILVTAAAPRVPDPLVAQLAEGGRLVIPIGETFQELYVFRKSKGKLTRDAVIPVRFVPMTGQIQETVEQP